MKIRQWARCLYVLLFNKMWFVEQHFAGHESWWEKLSAELSEGHWPTDNVISSSDLLCLDDDLKNRGKKHLQRHRKITFIKNKIHFITILNQMVMVLFKCQNVAQDSQHKHHLLLVRKASSWAPSQISCIRNSRCGFCSLCFRQHSWGFGSPLWEWKCFHLSKLL